MIYADKENLKTAVAKEILAVREKEMKFYTRNLSMVGTHAALLAGFAFTILSQHEFRMPPQGFLSYDTEVSLGMHPENQTYIDPIMKQYQLGIGFWPWQVWFQQLFQLLHLCFTAMGILLHLWTVYTTVVTNILGLHLALRGPEGSVDRAVKHMAVQNQFALRKFMLGLVLFIFSLLFFSLSEYHIFISSFVVICILSLAYLLAAHIKELMATFYLAEDDTITGQWFGLEENAPRLRRQTTSRFVRERIAVARELSKKGSRPTLSRLSSIGVLVSAGNDEPSWRKSETGVGNRVGAIAERLRITRPRSPSATGTRWATNPTRSMSLADSRRQGQAPSRVAEQLIFSQQKTADTLGAAKPSLRRRAPSRGRLFRQSTSSWRSEKNLAAAAAEEAQNERRSAAATQLQSRARGSIGRRSSREAASARDSRREESESERRGNSNRTLTENSVTLTDGSTEPTEIGAIVGSIFDKLGLQSPWDGNGNGSRRTSAEGAELATDHTTAAHDPHAVSENGNSAAAASSARSPARALFPPRERLDD